MHLNKILEQIKRHQSPSEAIDKLSTALEKHEGSLLEKGFTIVNVTEKMIVNVWSVKEKCVIVACVIQERLVTHLLDISNYQKNYCTRPWWY